MCVCEMCVCISRKRTGRSIRTLVCVRESENVRTCVYLYDCTNHSK